MFIKRVCIPAILSFFCILPLHAQKASALMTKPTATSDRFERHVPFRLVNGEILVSVYIKGREWSFIFDTGAATVISTELADELSLDGIGEVNLSDGDNKNAKHQVYSLDEINIGGVGFKNSMCIAILISSRL